jgi:hypothetical protein
LVNEDAKSEAPGGLERLRKEEDALLLEHGFELEGSDLCVKDGVCFGREAALQQARRD